ncbi:MAG TPA: MarR family winged helix-turn-helix transcriptional regulator [Methanocella sp.]|nr:MarR family winged helix-turn-helix transcriptional regulator [Methanocella sp.]
MDINIDEECLSKIAREVDWNSVSPAIGKLAVGPSYQLLKVVHRLEKTLRKELMSFDLTNTQFSMLTSLMVLTKSGKIVTQMDLAKYLNADKMMVSEVLRTLEKKGHIIREQHPVDRRAKSLVVTEKGLTTIDVALKRALILEEGFYSVLGDEKDDLIRLLKKLT